MSVVVSEPNQVGECPIWCEREQCLYWTDIQACKLYAYFLADCTTRFWPMPERLCALALTTSARRLLLALESRLAYFDLDTACMTDIVAVSGAPATRVNDGRCDRSGNFVFGSMHEGEPKERRGRFYRLNAVDGTLEQLALPAVAIANGICFSPDGRLMYYCDSLQREIRCCDYPSLRNHRRFAAVSGVGVPDGACVDAQGYVWSASWGDGWVTRYRPDGGVDQVLEAGALHSTCPAFGGTELNQLFCTSAIFGLSHPKPEDGALLGFALAAVRGLPESRFELKEANR